MCSFLAKKHVPYSVHLIESLETLSGLILFGSFLPVPSLRGWTFKIEKVNRFVFYFNSPAGRSSLPLVRKTRHSQCVPSTGNFYFSKISSWALEIFTSKIFRDFSQKIAEISQIGERCTCRRTWWSWKICSTGLPEQKYTHITKIQLNSIRNKVFMLTNWLYRPF